MKYLIISLLGLFFMSGCFHKEDACPECEVCQPPVVCKSDIEVLEAHTKDWVCYETHCFKAMKKLKSN